jgi:hypothetical protein
MSSLAFLGVGNFFLLCGGAIRDHTHDHILVEMLGRLKWWAVYPPNSRRKLLFSIEQKFVNYCDGPTGDPFRVWLSADVPGQSRRSSGIQDPSTNHVWPLSFTSQLTGGIRNDVSFLTI